MKRRNPGATARVTSTTRIDEAKPTTAGDAAIEWARITGRSARYATATATTGRIVHPYGKDPVGHLVPHGFCDFTDDVDTVIRWWSRTPWNIGVRVPESMFVLDVDGPDGIRAGQRTAGTRRAATTRTVHCRRPSPRSPGRGEAAPYVLPPPTRQAVAKRLPAREWSERTRRRLCGAGRRRSTPTAVSGMASITPVAAPPPWLVDLLRPEPPAPSAATPCRSARFFGPSIADEYCATVSWADILEPHGWTLRPRC